MYSTLSLQQQQGQNTKLVIPHCRSDQLLRYQMKCNSSMMLYSSACWCCDVPTCVADLMSLSKRWRLLGCLTWRMWCTRMCLLSCLVLAPGFSTWRCGRRNLVHLLQLLHGQSSVTAGSLEFSCLCMGRQWIRRMSTSSLVPSQRPKDFLEASTQGK